MAKLLHIAIAVLLFDLAAALPAAGTAPCAPTAPRFLVITPPPDSFAPGTLTGSVSLGPDPQPTSNSFPGLTASEIILATGFTLAGPDTVLSAADGTFGAGSGADGEPEGAEDRPRQTWHWRRAGGANYLGVALVGAGTIYVESEHGRPKGKWKGHNGFDESIRDALRLHSRRDRDAAHTVGDLLMWGMIAAPVLDSFATLGIRDGSWDTLWQTEMVNLESFAFTSFVSSLLQNVLAREKPFVRNCQSGGCDDQPNRSMPSGHVAFAFTGAGLICNHHRHQSLYRESAADRAACMTGIGLAAADGVARIMADHHYATDVAAGTAIGLFSGFVLPRLLHYAHPVAPPDAEQGKGSFFRRISLRPLVSDSGAGLNCELRF